MRVCGMCSCVNVRTRSVCALAALLRTLVLCFSRQVASAESGLFAECCYRVGLLVMQHVDEEERQKSVFFFDSQRGVLIPSSELKQQQQQQPPSQTPATTPEQKEATGSASREGGKRTLNELREVRRRNLRVKLTASGAKVARIGGAPGVPAAAVVEVTVLEPVAAPAAGPPAGAAPQGAQAAATAQGEQQQSGRGGADEQAPTPAVLTLTVSAPAEPAFAPRAFNPRRATAPVVGL